MQPLLVQLGVVAQHLAQRGRAAVVEVGRRQPQVAQAGHLELAVVPVLKCHVHGGGGAAARRVVVEGTQQVVAAGLQLADAAVPARVDAAGLGKVRQPQVVELAVAEGRPQVAGVAAPAAEEQRQPALRGLRIACRGLTVATRDRIAEVVEGRAAAAQRGLPGGQRLGHVDGDPFIVGAGCLAEGGDVALAQRRCVAHGARHLCQATAHLARIEQRAQALRPQVVVGAVPAVPALQVQVVQRQRVAVAARQACASRPAVAEAQRGLVAAGAGDAAVGRQRRLVEQLPAEGDGRRLAPDPVRRVGLQRRWPGAEGQDARDVVVVQRRGQRVGRGQQRHRGKQRRPALHCTVSGWASRRDLPAASRHSKTSSQRPGMWNISPSARYRPAPCGLTLGR